MKKSKLKIFLIIFLILAFLAVGGVALLLYGPYHGFRDWLITTAMTTKSHQYLATSFYPNDIIQKVLDENEVIESGQATDTSLIHFKDYDDEIITYKNKYDKEILTKDNDTYKLININENGLRGYLVAIYDPSKVKIATAKQMGITGEMLISMAEREKAIVAMNASGFIDPNYNSNGGIPHGIVIKDGKLVSNNTKAPVGGGLIGFDKNNTLILNSKMTGQQAIDSGIRDAVEFGPYLIVNGEASFIRGNGGWGQAPRSAIAQRKDGIVLFLVMDGRDYTSGVLGADMVDMTEILLRYGAYNAANLDGGTSSGLVIKGQLINKPINGSGKQKTRAIPNGWIVLK